MTRKRPAVAESDDRKHYLSLAPNVAFVFGRRLRAWREAASLAMRTVTILTGGGPGRVSYQYLSEIEGGTKMNVDLAKIEALGRVYRFPPNAMDNRVLKARILSALEWRGIKPAEGDAVWAAVEKQLTTLGYAVTVDEAALHEYLVNLWMQP